MTRNPLEGLRTPAALVDLDRLERNCRAMRERAQGLGVRLRPHVKTHKCTEVARLQLGGTLGPITVSTLAEARAFADAGFDDITYAVPIVAAKLGEALALGSRVRLGLLLENEEAAAAVAAAGAAVGRRVPVWLEVDCGGRRTGVDPERPESVDLAGRIAASPHLELRGLLTHAGQAYSCRSRDEAARVACTERDATVRFADRLRAEGIQVAEVSVGSTPTMAAATHLAGVTEIRPGNYAFFDAFQTAIGSCSLDDCAFTVLATVIARFPDRRELVVDAGALALSKDAGPAHVDPDCGFGVVLDAAGRARPDLRVVSLSQEHGVLRSRGALEPGMAIGTLVRIVPNHACLAAALFDRYALLRDGAVAGEWRPLRGW